MVEELSEERQLLKWLGILQVGIFRGGFWRREFDGWEFPGGNFPGDNFSRTVLRTGVLYKHLAGKSALQKFSKIS